MNYLLEIKLKEFRNKIKELSNDFFNYAGNEENPNIQQLNLLFSKTLLNLHQELNVIINEEHKNISIYNNYDSDESLVENSNPTIPKKKRRIKIDKFL